MTSQNQLRLRSQDYYRRRAQLVRARILLLLLITASMTLLLGISLSEGWVVKALLSPESTLFQFTWTITVSFLFLFIYCFVMARMTLHISYHMVNAGVAKTGVSTLFLVVYIFILFQIPNPQVVVPLAAGKIFSVFLFFLFWQSQLSSARMEMRTHVPPRVFLVSWQAFFVCRWVLLACWLLLCLSFALALVSAYPVIDLKGWEGVTLLSTFYFLFRIFVRNPHAHAPD